MLTVGSICSGYGGLDLAVEEVLAAETAWHCEVDQHASTVLAAHWPATPNLGDITTVDWSTVEPVDVICGGTPCQDLSAAGKRAGMAPGTRSGLWSAMAAAIDSLRPSWVVWENVLGALSACAHTELEPCPRCVGGDGPHRPVLRAAGRVVGDLATLGYDAAWVTVAAADIGAPHRRERVFVLGWHAADPLDASPWTPEPLPLGCPPGRWSTAGAPRCCGPDPDADSLRSTGEPARPGVSAATDTDHRASSLAAVANADGAGRRRIPWASHGWDALHADLGGDPDGRSAARWGSYAPAVARWERALGRPAPPPTDDDERLNARAVEWMMGLPDGWVTDHVSRTAALKILGNGVVPQQAACALRYLLEVQHQEVAA